MTCPQPVVKHHKCRFTCYLSSGLKTVAKVTADVTGISDVINCVTNPGIASCAMAVAVVATYAVPGAGVELRAVREGVEVERLARAGMAADRLAASSGSRMSARLKRSTGVTTPARSASVVVIAKIKMR